MILTNYHIYNIFITPSTPLSTDMSVDFHHTSLDDDTKSIIRLTFVYADNKYYFHIVHYPSLNITIEDVADYGVSIIFKALINGTTIIPDEIPSFELSIAVNFFGSNYTHTTLSTITDFISDISITITPDADYSVVNYSILVGNIGNYTKIHPSILNNVITFNHNDLIDYMFSYSSPDLRINVATITLTGFAMVLYQNTAENNRVDKETYLVFISALNGTLRTQCSMINPSISIEMNSVPNFNYVWIPSFNRYYFVASITSVQKNIWNIDLAVDVLMSYKATIYSQSAEIERQEFDFNPDLVDSEELAENEIDYIYIEDNTGEKIFGKNYNPDTQSYTDEVKPSTRSYVVTYYKGS